MNSFAHKVYIKPGANSSILHTRHINLLRLVQFDAIRMSINSVQPIHISFLRIMQETAIIHSIIGICIVQNKTKRT